MVLLILATVSFGASIGGRTFRLYSFASMLIMVAFGVLTSFAVRGVATGEPTPWLGILERINIGAFLLWVVVFAISLLRALAPRDFKTRTVPGMPPSALPAR